ncbi:dimethyl sulfoxide reductase anchor subunit family protein [Raoultibacter massiliensis]|uniref:DmsC/YnfH family molybdoenzyme membrane anchor subunit n=1 Tax=Raoultibacter massiliensis TaxID=1852371 RepID=A0ABV1JAS5_9ACTN
MSIQWSLVLFTALTGLAGWLFACVLISEWTNRAERTRFIAMLSGLVLMAVGGFASVLHLSHPENMLAALSHPTSGIFIEAVLVGISALCAIVYLVLHARKASDTVRKVFLVISAIAGVALSFMAGSSYMMSSCPAWDTPLLPLGYLGTALAMGSLAYLALVGARGSKEDASFFAKVALAGSLVGVVLAALYVFMVPEVLNAAGSWAIAAVVGNLAAAVCAGVAMKKPESATALAAVGCVLALGAGMAFRCAMWLSMVPINDFFNMI